MSDTTSTETTTEDTTDTSAEQVEAVETETVDGEDSLADAGKKALDAMKAQRNAARQAERDARARIAEMEAQIAISGKSAEEQQLEAARRDAESAATKKANERILRSELRGAAKGKLADPADALMFLDTSEFDVDENGEVDADAINDAIDDLIARKPHLGVPDTRRFQGGADQGAQAHQKVAQLTRDQLSTMSPEQIDAARKNGQLDRILGVTS